ncbi:MAG: type II secretion system protein GspG [Pirellulales bacterium]
MVSSAVGLYQLDMGRTPPPNLEALSEKPADGANNSKYAGPYLKQVLPPDPWGSPYKYEAIDANQYRVWSSGPDGTDGTADDVSLTQSNWLEDEVPWLMPSMASMTNAFFAPRLRSRPAQGDVDGADAGDGALGDCCCGFIAGAGRNA